MSGNRRVKYLYNVYCEIYDLGGTSCRGIGGLNISVSVL
jgi:hypothetical protein